MPTMTIGEWLKANREAIGLSQRALARLTEVVAGGEMGRVSQSTIADLERGEKDELRPAKLHTLERAMKVRYPEVIHHFNTPFGLARVTENSASLLPRYSPLNEIGNETNAAIGHAVKDDHAEEIPLLSDIRGGLPDGGVYDGTFEALLPVRALYGLRDPQAFALRVVGDSMAPRLPEGTIVYVAPNEERLDGDPCFVQFGGERDYMATIKNVFDAGDDWLLIAGNPNFEPQTDRVPKALVLRVLPVVRYSVPTH